MAIGIAISAPVGPVNVMAIQRALRFGFFNGLFAGAGAAIADALFAGAAAFGVSAVSQFISGHHMLIQAVGGVLLLVFGALTWRMHPHLDDGGGGGTGRLSGLLTAFAMTITNPGAALGSVALIGALGPLAPDGDDAAAAVMLVLGVIAGGVLWWVTVAGIATRLRDRATDAWLERINRIAGAALIVFGAVVLAQLAYALAR
ncbi:LysE family translocator [Breoghania sp. L-A4]|nr:LysE family translocator [Breoghania sp. L-A4]